MPLAFAACQEAVLLPGDAGVGEDGGVVVDAGIDDAGVPNDAGVAEDGGVIDAGPVLCAQPRGPPIPYEPDGSEDYVDPRDDVFNCNGDCVLGTSEVVPEADVLATWSRVETINGQRHLVLDFRTLAPAVLTVDKAGANVTFSLLDEQGPCGARPNHPGFQPTSGIAGQSAGFGNLSTQGARHDQNCSDGTPVLSPCAIAVSQTEPRFWRVTTPCDRNGRDVCGLRYDFFTGATDRVAFGGNEAFDLTWDRDTGEQQYIESRGGHPPVDDFVSICALTCPAATP
jgi:hypothetical protein